MPSPDRQPGTPVCPSCSRANGALPLYLTKLKTERLRKTWEEEEGEKWAWRPGSFGRPPQVIGEVTAKLLQSKLPKLDA